MSASLSSFITLLNHFCVAALSDFEDETKDQLMAFVFGNPIECAISLSLVSSFDTDILSESSLTNITISFMAMPPSFLCCKVVPSVFGCNFSFFAASLLNIEALCHAYSCKLFSMHVACTTFLG